MEAGSPGAHAQLRSPRFLQEEAKMAERYDESESVSRPVERREDYERNDWGREEPYNRIRGGRGNWEEFNRSEERYGRNDFDRERRGGEYGGEFGGRGEFGSRGNWGREQG